MHYWHQAEAMTSAYLLALPLRALDERDFNLLSKSGGVRGMAGDVNLQLTACFIEGKRGIECGRVCTSMAGVILCETGERDDGKRFQSITECTLTLRLFLP